MDICIQILVIFELKINTKRRKKKNFQDRVKGIADTNKSHEDEKNHSRYDTGRRSHRSSHQITISIVLVFENRKSHKHNHKVIGIIISLSKHDDALIRNLL